MVVGAVAGAGYVASRKLTVQVRKAEGGEQATVIIPIDMVVLGDW